MRAGLQSGLETFWRFRPAQLAKQFFFGNSAVEGTTSDPGKWSARAYYRVQQTSGGMTVTKFQAIRKERLDAEMAGQRTEDMVEELTYQNDTLAAADRFQEFFGGFRPKSGLQHVVKILFSQQVKAVLTDAAQQRVQRSRGESAACGVGKGPRQRHERHTGTSSPTLRKTLRVPSEKADRAHRSHFEKRSLDAPIGLRARILGRRSTTHGNTGRVGQAITHDRGQLAQE